MQVRFAWRKWTSLSMLCIRVKEAVEWHPKSVSMSTEVTPKPCPDVTKTFSKTFSSLSWFVGKNEKNGSWLLVTSRCQWWCTIVCWGQSLLLALKLSRRLGQCWSVIFMTLWKLCHRHRCAKPRPVIQHVVGITPVRSEALALLQSQRKQWRKCGGHCAKKNSHVA